MQTGATPDVVGGRLAEFEVPLDARGHQRIAGPDRRGGRGGEVLIGRHLGGLRVGVDGTVAHRADEQRELVHRGYLRIVSRTLCPTLYPFDERRVRKSDTSPAAILLT
jgi:hypothetical protein